MDQCYNIINQCLATFMSCDVETMDKLRIEGRLIHIKKILLSDPLLSVALSGSCFFVSVFEMLLDQVFEIKQRGCHKQELTNLKDLVDRIEAMLGALVAPKNANETG